MSKFLHRRRQGGFTLIELLIVIAIIGIIAALLIPNFLDALNKAKQKKDMSTMRNVGESWFSWYTDLFAGAAAAGQQQLTLPATYDHANVEADLTPQYIQDVPELNAWGQAFVWCRAATLTDVMNTAGGEVALATLSPGRGKTTPDASCGGPITVTTFDPTDYAQDLAWADGQFIRFPKKDVSP